MQLQGLEAMLAQITLLLEQRMLLPANRYCYLKQLRDHDQKIFTAVSWLQQQLLQQSGTVPPQWLDWVLSETDKSLLPLVALQQFSQPEQSWLFLHQLKLRLFSGIREDWQLLLQQRAVNGVESRCWTLAYYLQLQLNPFATDNAVSADALWYLVLTQAATLQQELARFHPSEEQLSILRQLAMQSATVAPHSVFSTFSAKQLIAAVVPHRLGLMLLVTMADDMALTKLINYLAQADEALAVTAMGFSGQLKFVPLLAELAQQQPLHNAAADALTLLLGVTDCDAYLAQPDLCRHFHTSRNSARHLSGVVLTELQLDTVWRSGNALQRQLASCLRKQRIPGQAIIPADALQVTL